MSLIDHCQTIPYFFFFNPYIKIELALYVFYDLWKETMNVFVILFYGFVYCTFFISGFFQSFFSYFQECVNSVCTLIFFPQNIQVKGNINFILI